MKEQEPIVFVAAKRTPFGAFGGSFKGLSATDLAVHAAKAALRQGNITPESVEHVVFGNVLQTSADAIYLARHVGLRCEVPESVPAVTTNRLCGSGFEAIADAARRIRLGEARVVLAGGTESMSQAPYVLRGARFGYRLGNAELEDSLMAGLTDSYTGLPMAMTAERLAEQYGIHREQCDEYALRSQQRAVAGQKDGRFSMEMAPVPLREKGVERQVSQDEHPRPDCQLEGLARLKPVFKKDGVVTAGNASGMVDGACALVMTSKRHAETNGWTVLGELVATFAAGCDPKIMGIGPVPACRGIFQRSGMDLKAMSLIEINEAFAPQYLAVEKELHLPREITNIDGGAIALGHPLGASGARITAHLLYRLKEQGGGLGLGSACIGGGQGMAVIVRV